MAHPSHRGAFLALILMVGALVPVQAEAQVLDSISTLLGSPNLASRADGVSWLLTIPTGQWNSFIRSQIVTLVNNEGESLLGANVTEEGAGELAGEYHIDLVNAALALNDASALPGLVTLGIQVNSRAKQYVAAQGATALPLLQRAYAKDQTLRIPVVQTIGIMLLSGGGLDADATKVANGLLLAASGYELSFLRNAGQFPQFAGIVAWTADSASSDAERERATRALPGFSSRLGQFTTSELWRRELLLLDVACDSEEQSHCESAQNLGRTVQGHLESKRWGPARNTINAFVQQLTQNCNEHALSEGACRALIPGAKQVFAKLL